MGLLGKVKHQIIGQLASQDVVGMVQPPRLVQPKRRRLLQEEEDPVPELPSQSMPVAFATDRIRATCGKLVVQLISEKGQLVLHVTDTKGKTIAQTIVEQP